MIGSMHFGRGIPPEKADRAPVVLPKSVQPRKAMNRISKKAARRERELAKTKKRLLLTRGDRCEAALLYFAYASENGGYEKSSAVQDADANCSRRAMELHHKCGRDFKDADRDDLLLLLCSNCHRLATDAHPVAYLVGLSRRSWETAA